MTTGDLVFLLAAGGSAVYLVQQKLANDAALAAAAAAFKPTTAIDRVVADVKEKAQEAASSLAKGAVDVVHDVSTALSFGDGGIPELVTDVKDAAAAKAAGYSDVDAYRHDTLVKGLSTALSSTNPWAKAAIV